MKILKIGVGLFGLLFVGLGVAMAATNPDQVSYDHYATQQLTAYLKENACSQAPDFLENLLKTQCETLLERNQNQIRELISDSTTRRNYIVLSIYETNLSISEFLPAYEFETVGVFQNFHTYKAVRR